MSVEVQLGGIYENEAELSKKDEYIEEKLEFVEETLFEIEHGSGKGLIKISLCSQKLLKRLN